MTQIEELLITFCLNTNRANSKTSKIKLNNSENDRKFFENLLKISKNKLNIKKKP